jgi:hypothetical protein
MRSVVGAQGFALGAWVPSPLVPLAVYKMPRRHADMAREMGAGGGADGREEAGTRQDRTEALQKTQRRKCLIEMEKVLLPLPPAAKGTGVCPLAALPLSNRSAPLPGMARMDTEAGSAAPILAAGASVDACPVFRWCG